MILFVKHRELHSVQCLWMLYVDIHLFCSIEFKTLKYHIVKKNLNLRKGTIFKYEEKSNNEKWELLTIENLRASITVLNWV